MKSDLTHLILINPNWLLFGLLTYFILSLFKVHIIWDIQPTIYNNRNGDNIFKDYFWNFFQSFFRGTRLIKATFKYLFNYKEKDFPLLKDDQAKPIKRWLNVLDGFTTFLKPYLIFAFIWTILEFWISNKLLYDESKISFGEIQKLLTIIEGIPFVKHLQNNKGLIFLFYGIICVLIPFLYEREDSTKKFKKYFSRTLIYLSLLANISFFGVQAGKTTADKSRNLSELQTEITAIHDSIYKELVVGIEFNDLRDGLKYDDELYKEEINRFDSLTETTNKLQIDASLKLDLQSELSKHHAEIETNSTVENSIAVNKNRHPNGGLKSPSAYFNNYYKTNFGSGSTYSNYADYMGDKSSWNKEAGKEILTEVNNVVKEGAAVATVFEKKLEMILGCLFDYGLDASVNKVFGDLKIGTHKTLKKVVSTVLSENYKKTIVDKAIKILNFIKPDFKTAKKTFEAKSTPYQTVTTEEFNKFSTENTNYFFKEENSRIEANIKRKINSFDIILPESSEIISRLRVKTEGEAIELLNELSSRGYNNGYRFKDGVGLGENIKRMESDAYLKVFASNFNTSNLHQYNNSLKEYNGLLANQSSNLTLMKAVNITKFVGVCNGSGATICIKCGLPCAFPICLSKI